MMGLAGSLRRTLQRSLCRYLHRALREASRCWILGEKVESCKRHGNLRPLSNKDEEAFSEEDTVFEDGNETRTLHLQINIPRFNYFLLSAMSPHQHFGSNGILDEAVLPYDPYVISPFILCKFKLETQIT